MTCNKPLTFQPHPFRTPRGRLLLLAAALTAAVLVSSVTAQPAPPPPPPAAGPASVGALPGAPADGKPIVRARSMWSLVEDGGWIGGIIILLSVVALGFAVEHAIAFRREAIIPADAWRELDARLKVKAIDASLAYCQEAQPSLLTNVVQAGLLRYKSNPFGHLEFRAAMEEAGEEETARFYRKTEALALIGAVAPMLGLLGTVAGMIESFDVIAGTGGMARPDQLAGGISKALVTTLEGLIVAIPAMVAFTYFRTKIDSLVAEAGKHIEQMTAPLANPN